MKLRPTYIIRNVILVLLGVAGLFAAAWARAVARAERQGEPAASEQSAVGTEMEGKGSADYGRK